MLGLDILGAVMNSGDPSAATTAATVEVTNKAQGVLSKAKKSPKIANYARKAIDRAKNLKAQVEEDERVFEKGDEEADAEGIDP